MTMGEKTLQDIWEVVTFIKDNAVTKKELNEQFDSFEVKIDHKLYVLESRIDQKMDVLESRIEKRIGDSKSELMSHIDGFVVMNQRLDTEFVALKAKYDRLEAFAYKVAAHLHLELT